LLFASWFFFSFFFVVVVFFNVVVHLLVAGIAMANCPAASYIRVPTCFDTDSS